MMVGVTGHRPDKLGGYEHPNHPIRRYVRRWLSDSLVSLEADTAITGMAQGVDQDFAQVCIDLDVPFQAAIPATWQASKWPDDARRQYERLLEKAADIIIVCEDHVPFWEAMSRRNEVVVDRCHILLAVHDGSPGGTAGCLAIAKKKKRTRSLFDWNAMKANAVSRGLAVRDPLCECVTKFCPCPVIWSDHALQHDVL